MNRGTDSILSVYSDARAEYTKQLCVFLVPAFFQFFTELLEKAKSAMANEPKKVLWQFQNLLNEIHDWNMQKVNTEIQGIQTNCGCDYLEDLLTAVFIAHTKVLTAIRLSSNNKKVEINIPKVEHFLFKVLCETSKMLWSSTYLFRDGIPGIEKQQNYRSIEQLINEGILQAVRSLVPVKSILRDFVNNEGSPDDDNEEDKEDKEDKDMGEVKEVVPESNNSVPQNIIEVPTEKITLETPVTDLSSVKSEKNETKSAPQTIIIEDKPNVKFGEFNAVFDADHPLDSDMIYESTDSSRDEDAVPALEILDQEGSSLVADLDFDSLDNGNVESRASDAPEAIGASDYESL